MTFKTKLAALVGIFAVLAAETAFAGYTAVSDGSTITLYPSSSESSAVILAGYSEDGTLVGAQYIQADGDKYTASVIENAVSYRTGTPDKDGFEELSVETLSPSVTAPPEASPEASPAASPEASPAASSSPQRPVYPSIYEKEKDAVYTLSVVKNVSSVSNDGEDAYSVTAYTRGEEETYIIPADVTIAVSSDYYSDLKGSDASALKKGDIVYFEKSLSNKFRAMAFIYRPVADDIMTTDGDYGTSFEKLISSGGTVYAAENPGTALQYGGSGSSSSRYTYAFGLVGDKSSAELTLYNKSGLYANALNVQYEPETIVYTVDVSSKNDVTVGGGNTLTKSFIPKSSFDDDDNITTFSTDDVYNYAFARIVNGTATEIVLYVNYND